MKGTLTLVLGGVRSGKSHFAEQLASKLGGDDVLFVATAENRDGEMAHRIRKHQESRPTSWHTLEQPRNVGEAILRKNDATRVVLVDCLTILVSNLLCQEPQIELTPLVVDATRDQLFAELDSIIAVAKQRNTHVIVVSGEVGLGVVPEYALGRAFRDLLGWANQKMAANATATYWMVSGHAVPLREVACSVDQVADQLCRLCETRGTPP